MKATFYVGSKMNCSVFPVEGTGMTPQEARNNAVQVGRAMHRIGDPIALTEHEAAVRLRQKFIAEHAPKMPDLNGRSPMNFDNRYGHRN